MSQFINASESQLIQEEEEDEEEEEEDEMPEEWKLLDPVDRIGVIMKTSLQMMCLGTACVMIFSDPMVDVLTQMGLVTGVNTF
mmetsp:Transcript_21614/g.48157  ORF Transcript_21614/g.48157 Transcript_21614/m.48157 type:complete len:83 (+) Transcript_21614:1110-1358(+)